jgi:hypothetical protein
MGSGASSSVAVNYTAAHSVSVVEELTEIEKLFAENNDNEAIHNLINVSKNPDNQVFLCHHEHEIVPRLVNYLKDPTCKLHSEIMEVIYNLCKALENKVYLCSDNLCLVSHLVFNLHSQGNSDAAIVKSLDVINSLSKSEENISINTQPTLQLLESIVGLLNRLFSS